MSNMIFGKSGQRSENYLNAKVVSDATSFQREVNKFTFRRSIDFENDVSLIIHRRTSFLAKTPIYLAFCILQISKLCVARFYYDHLMPLAFYNQATGLSLGYSDTDSLFFQLSFESQNSSKKPLKGAPRKTGPMGNYYQLLRDMSYILDMSVYAKNHPLFTACSDPDEKQKLLALRKSSYNQHNER